MKPFKTSKDLTLPSDIENNCFNSFADINDYLYLAGFNLIRVGGNNLFTTLNTFSHPRWDNVEWEFNPKGLWVYKILKHKDVNFFYPEIIDNLLVVNRISDLKEFILLVDKKLTNGN